MNGEKPPPFDRALRFLQYRRAQQWIAITSSIVLATLILLLLGLTGLFLALVVSRGQLETEQRQSFLEQNEEHRRWLEQVLRSEEERQHFLEQLKNHEGVGLLALAWSAHQRQTIWEPVLVGMVRAWPWTRHNWSVMVALLVGALTTAVLRWGLQLLVHWSAAGAASEAATRFRRSVYLQTLRLGSLLLKRQGSNQAISVFTRHVEAVQEGLYLWLTSRWREPTRLILLAGFAPLVEFGTSGGFPYLTLAFVCLAGLTWVVGGQLFVWYRWRERSWNQRAAEQLSLLQEGLRIIRLVRGYLMEVFYQQRMERQLNEYEAQTKRQRLGQVAFQETLILLGVMVLTVLAFVAAWNTLENQMGLASILILTLTLGGLYFPIARMVGDRVILKRATESAAKLFDFLDQPGEVTESGQARSLEAVQRELQFDNVSLRSPGESRLLLDRVSFTVLAGQRIALVAADRTTLYALAHLLVRFYDPDQGVIRVDGHNLRRFTLESLRSQINLVLQSDLVFSDTVANNISCGDPNFKLPKIMEAAKMAHAHQFIQDLPQGYETVIGEQGHSLSLFQRFQIALARAILRNPSVVVIEEPAVGLNEEEKTMLEDTYARFLPQRTVFFIPHRFHTLRNSDLVLFFHQGHLEGQGKHRELLNASELYRQICFVEFHLLADLDILPFNPPQQGPGIGPTE
ncbi:MAG: ABC transporter ATP-binding protein/permease [Gemmatales bacterium]|nr:ABC transporter ATP-binding protein/permease [Gemmatales bacterium]MDW8221515.1 ABC transporter ATP-binding protein [Gemmatales bacterium]